MQLGSFFHAFEGKALRCGFVGRQKFQPWTQGACEFGPGFFIETRCAAFCVALLAFASGFERVQKLRTQEVVRRGKLQHPRFLHVAIADGAKTAEKFATGFAKSAPGGMRINFPEHAGERTAPAQRDAQIVDGFFFGHSENPLALAKHALHPIQESLRLGRFGRKGDNRSHDYLDAGIPKPVGGSPEEWRSSKVSPAVGRCPAALETLWKTQWKRVHPGIFCKECGTHRKQSG